MNSRLLAGSMIEQFEDKYILEALNTEEKSNISMIVKRLGTIAASLAVVVALAFSGTTVAVARGSITAYNLLKEVFPEFAAEMFPVFVSCEDEEIRMEVEAVLVEEDMAKVYISMQDLTGNRIDGTIDLFDSYRIESTVGQIGTCELVGFSADDKKATFLITLQNMDGETWKDSVMKFSMLKFLYGKGVYEKQLTAIAIKEIPVVKELQYDVNIRGRGGFGLENLDINIGYLLQNPAQIFSPVEGVTVTAYGFVDEKLRVQVCYDDILETDNHGHIYLKDENGETILPYANVAFWGEDKSKSYEEYFFDISSAEDLSKYTIWGHFVTCGNMEEGDWRVSFPIEEGIDSEQ